MGQEGTDSSNLKEGRALMLENGSWAFMPDDLFLDSKTPGNGLKGNFTEPTDMGFCEADAILDTSDDRNNSGLYDFPVAGISPTNCGLNLFGNDQGNEECSYLSYDGWSDMSYIDDGLFRSCDSRPETVTNDNEMPWFSSSSHVTDGLGGASESSFKSFGTEATDLKSISQHHEPSVYHVPRSGNPDSDEKNILSYYSTVGHSSYVNSLGVNAESILKPYSEEQAMEVSGVIDDNVFPVIETNCGSSEMHGQLRRKHMKNQRPTEAQTEAQSFEYSNGSSLVVSGTSQKFANPMKWSSELSPNAKPCTSGKTGDKLYWEHCGQAISSSRSQHEAMVSHPTILEHPHQIENVVDGRCEIGNVCKELPDVDAESSGALEGSGLSSAASGKMSVEESSFQQLQHVMEQLDFRTKLRLRDGLYRLAYSADQRNKMGQSCRGGEREKHGFMDVETDTNLIDRSIAHLLFHKPVGEEPLGAQASLSFAYDHRQNSNFTFQ